jgi:hypothetical protein
MKLIKKLFFIGFILSFLAMTFLAGIITNDVLSDPEVIIKKEPCFPSVSSVPPVTKETPPKTQPVPQEEEEDDWKEEWEKKLEREEDEREAFRQALKMEIETEELMSQLEQSQKDFDDYWAQQHIDRLWEKAMEGFEE